MSWKHVFGITAALGLVFCWAVDAQAALQAEKTSKAEKKPSAPAEKPARKEAAEPRKPAPPSQPIPPPVIVRKDARLTIPVVPNPGAPPLAECVATVGPLVPVTAVAFSPDGKLLAAAGYQEVVLWDLAEAKLLKRVGAGQLSGSVHALAFSKDGRSLAAGDGAPCHSGSVKIFDVQTGQQTAAFQDPKDVVYALALSPDGKLLAAGGADGLAYVWSLADQQLVTAIQEHGDWVDAVGFSPDGKLLATASSDRSVRVWEVGTWKSLNKFQQPDAVQAAAFSPDGQLLAWAVAGAQERMVRWRQPVEEPEEKDKAAAAKKPPRTIPQIRTLDTAGGMPLDLIWGSVRQGSQQQARLYVACADKTVKVFNSSGGLMASLTGHGDWVYCIAASADGSKFASGSADGTVKLWTGADNRPLATLVQLACGKEDWLILTAQGFFATSTPDSLKWEPKATGSQPPPSAEDFVAKYQNPEAVRNLLAGKPAIPPPAPPKPSAARKPSPAPKPSAPGKASVPQEKPKPSPELKKPK